MREHSVNTLNNFIAGWYINPDVCDSIINVYKNSNKVDGHLGGRVNKNLKDSKDVILDINDLSITYYPQQLLKCSDEYFKLYPYVNAYGSCGIAEKVQIQKYAPGGGFHVWHTERSGILPPFVTRHMVFMTYLNDIDDMGETEFYHQKLKIKPEKGLTLIWPTDWTFTHRGISSPTQEKYVITGWFSYLT
jgi:hypothetical protein